MLIEELIEKAFCEGYEYAQKEFAAAKRLLERGKNHDEKVEVPHFIRTTSQFRKAVANKIGSNDIAWVREYAKKGRNNTLGARTIDQISNITSKHAMRVTPKRAEIIEAAVKARDNASKAIQENRKQIIEIANKLKDLL